MTSPSLFHFLTLQCTTVTSSTLNPHCDLCNALFGSTPPQESPTSSVSLTSLKTPVSRVSPNRHKCPICAFPWFPIIPEAEIQLKPEPEPPTENPPSLPLRRLRHSEHAPDSPRLSHPKATRYSDQAPITTKELEPMLENPPVRRTNLAVRFIENLERDIVELDSKWMEEWQVLGEWEKFELCRLVSRAAREECAIAKRWANRTWAGLRDAKGEERAIVKWKATHGLPETK
ncbi:hypothetical protein B0J11DRAFT_508679 [Dendryphion nanum]|uniref:Uncharacterized protein n=1 Tax=Dendryphion nanum TaxID=256645 RepID=A0A9P9DJ67_9PLEO|nr:hypothetical protein B0J11DRAFT_508679 [Dendryphion nanum]